MSYGTLLISRSGGVGTITLHRPEKLNAISLEMLGELVHATEAVASDPSVRAVVVTGAGRGFCSGADLGGQAPTDSDEPNPETAGNVKRIVLGLRTMAKPVVMAVNGCAVGAGFSLALAGDLLIASDKATFGSVFARIGLIPDFGGTYFLPRHVGTSKACELIFTGKIIDAKEAEKIGLVNQVVPHERFEEAVMDVAGLLARGPSLAHAIAKKMVYDTANDLATAVELELRGISRLKQSRDFQEGVKAFAERRPAIFEGR